MCDPCRAISSLSHLMTGWTLTWLTGTGQSSFCSLTAAVSHVARERWLEVFWILLIGSRYRSAHWDLWNGTIAHDIFLYDTNIQTQHCQTYIYFIISYIVHLHRNYPSVSATEPHQATSHYLNQCWPRSVLPYGIIKPQVTPHVCWNLIKTIWKYFRIGNVSCGVLYFGEQLSIIWWHI